MSSTLAAGQYMMVLRARREPNFYYRRGAAQGPWALIERHAAKTRTAALLGMKGWQRQGFNQFMLEVTT